MFPPVLTLYNLFYLIVPNRSDELEKAGKTCEYFTVVFGAFCTLLWMMLRGEAIRWESDWSEQLYNSELHTPISGSTYLTIISISLLALCGYLVLRLSNSSKKLPPLVSTLAISSLYLGSALCTVSIIQMAKHDIVFCIYPLNMMFIFAKTVRDVVLSWKREHQDLNELDEKVKFARMRRFMHNSSNWPWLGLILALPMLGLVVAFLTLFGQSPDSIIRAWTDTADWTFSQQIPPENIPYDYHYLCTVAAGGHRKIVKPLRTGVRHGHRVLVNRQLCVANAFEQLLSEKMPKTHRFVRHIYDKYGYPIARHIKTPYAADAVWFIMKPLEWFFVAVLYLFDSKPENRIAVQYPHAPLPEQISDNPQ